MPVPVGWEGLSDEERAFLREANARAQHWSPGVRLVLFGCRAAGRSRPDSDWDLLLVFPDVSEERLRGFSVGDVTTLGRQRGLTVDVSRALASEWDNPDEASEPFFARVKATGIAVPS